MITTSLNSNAPPISSFADFYAFLSNFYPCPVEYQGLMFKNSEAAYQAQKCLNVYEKVNFTSLAANEAKQLGKKIALVPAWNDRSNRLKLRVMSEVVHAKFSQNDYLRTKLECTLDAALIEGNWWGDTYWGVCKNEGLNMLGKLLMAERAYWQALTKSFNG